jgi:hypothetical protein
LEFHVVPPIVPDRTTTIATTTTTNITGTIRVILQYTCGVGRLHPDAKVGWTTAGQVNDYYVTSPERPVSLSDLFPISTATAAETRFQPPPLIFPTQHVQSNLSRYDYVCFYGDSLMQQMVARDFHSKQNSPYPYYRDKVRNAFNVNAKLELATLHKWKKGIHRAFCTEFTTTAIGGDSAPEFNNNDENREQQLPLQVRGPLAIH